MPDQHIFPATQVVRVRQLWDGVVAPTGQDA